MKRLPNIHPGEILREEFMIPFGISANKLSKEIFIPRSRINVLVREKQRITADIALRLSKYFGTSVSLWLGLQEEFDLEEARLRIHEDLNNIIPLGKTNSSN